jgi:2-polyprenyl-6-methoxyphenol hydroxylase-like FAD-dependent oxidoreductase
MTTEEAPMTIGNHAVVVGAGMAGLLAARALADAYEQVTVIERDALPAGDVPRRAIPQGRHVHSLLPRGQACLEELLPGIGAELVAGGAVVYRPLEDMRFAVRGHQLARVPLGRSSVIASRAFLEGHVRRRVGALPNVEIVDRCDALGLTARADGTIVTGVRVLRRAAGSAAQELPADLVVVASGRGGRLGAWLEELGHPRPAEERLDLDLRYASRRLRLRPGALDGVRLLLHGARPELPRTIALFAQERGEWLLTLGGYGDHQPPGDPDGFHAFAQTVAPPDVWAALRDAEPLDDVARFRFPANVRRRYDRLDRLPRRLLPIGDAICAFNPIYGQGMTVAALEAVALRRCLREHGPLADRFLAAIAPAVDDAWRLATGADLAQPFIAGPRPLPVRLMGAYMDRLIAAAEHDGEVAAAFAGVIGLLDRPHTLLRPRLALRVLAAGARRRGRRPVAPSVPSGLPSRVPTSP